MNQLARNDFQALEKSRPNQGARSCVGAKANAPEDWKTAGASDALDADILYKLLEQCGNDAKGHRDRVLLLLGYETMRRRSELCNFTFEDLTQIPGRGHAIRLIRSKTDQEGASKLIPISVPLNTLITEWRDKYQLDGVILRSVDRHGNVGDRLRSGSIGTILNGLKANLVNDVHNCCFSGHSFRVGAAIDLLEAGSSLETIMLKGGWRSQDNAMNYLRAW